MEMLVLFLVLLAFAVVVPRYGVDSRGPYPPRQATPAADLAALRQWWARRHHGPRMGAGSG